MFNLFFPFSTKYIFIIYSPCSSVPPPRGCCYHVNILPFPLWMVQKIHKNDRIVTDSSALVGIHANCVSRQNAAIWTARCGTPVYTKTCLIQKRKKSKNANRNQCESSLTLFYDVYIGDNCGFLGLISFLLCCWESGNRAILFCVYLYKKSP